MILKHQKYAHFAKGLVEAVNGFGITGYGKREYERGPFFTGLSCVLNIPSFAICLKAPCSTTKDIEVSLRFAKKRWMYIIFAK